LDRLDYPIRFRSIARDDRGNAPSDTKSAYVVSRPRTVAFVDHDADRNGVSFSQALSVHCKRITGIPDDDFVGVDFSGTAILFGLDSDQKATAYLSEVTKRNGKYFCSRDIRNARWWHVNDLAYEVLISEHEDCSVNAYPLFVPDQLANLIQAVDITKRVNGDYVEIGVFKGTSARLTYRYMAAAGIDRECYFVDTFAGFNYDEAAEAADASL
jgi:hypothetical protein